MRRNAIALLFALALLVLVAPASPQVPRPHKADGTPRKIISLLDARRYLATAGFPRTVTVAADGSADYSTVTAALAYVATKSPSAEAAWQVLVFGGDASEAMPTDPYVSLIYYGAQGAYSGTAAFTITTSNDQAGMFQLSGDRTDGVALSADATEGEGEAFIATAANGSAAELRQNYQNGDVYGGNSGVTIAREGVATVNLTAALLSVIEAVTTTGTNTGPLIEAESVSAGGGGHFTVTRTGNVVATGTITGSSVIYGSTGVKDLAGSGTPEGAVTCPVGCTYRRTNGGTSTTFYVKESGTGSTGWVAK